MKKIYCILILLCMLLSGCTGYPTSTKTTNSNIFISSGSDTVDPYITTTKKVMPVYSQAGDKTEPKEQENVDKKPLVLTAEEVSRLGTKKEGWYFVRKPVGVPSDASENGKALLKKYNGYYLGDTSKKYIYLTFDEGYENGYTSKILDVLKENNVKACFFVTTPYIKSSKELIARMVEEGHIVGNHTTTHPSMADVSNFETFKKEITGCEEAFKAVTGKDMPKFFRPPMGEYNERSLYYTQTLGYKSIFWSFAYRDWVVTEQPTVEAAKKDILGHTHPGEVILLHAVSKTNTEILDSIIKEWKAQGYEIRSVEELS